MPGIIPRTSAGALGFNNANVENSADLPDSFSVDCDYLGLPSNCTARILPSQINALVSEMLNLAACFDPDGTWSCGDVDNLCTAFDNYRNGAGQNTLRSDIQFLLCGRPEADPGNDARFLYCDGAGNIFQTANLAGPCQGVVNAICASNPCRRILAACLITETEDDNGLQIADGPGGDSLLYMRSHSIFWDEAIDIPAGFTNNHGGQCKDTGQFTIPNTSDVNIRTQVVMTGDFAFHEEIPGARGALNFQLFSDPALTIPGLRLNYAFGNLDGGGLGRDFVNSSVATGRALVPPGGLTVYWCLSTSATPNNSFSYADSTVRITYEGAWARVRDGL